MITLILQPISVNSNEEERHVSLSGVVLTIDGVPYDLSEIPDGATVYHPILLEASRVLDDYIVVIHLPHGSTAGQSTRFPEPIELTEDGIVSLPEFGMFPDTYVPPPMGEEVRP